MKAKFTLLLIGLIVAAANAQQTVLERLVGTWEFDSEATLAPGQPPLKAKGIEIVRPMGSFWVVSEIKSKIGTTSFDALITFGGATGSNKVEGTFISSMSGQMVYYKGTLLKDSVELLTEMPNPMKGGAMTKMKDVIALQGNDKKTMKSFALEDGKWVEFYSATFTRKK